MNKLSLPPKNVSEVLSGEKLADKLKSLIGMKFILTNKPRTDGSMLRKLITRVLDDNSIETADKEDYVIIPVKKKGIPKLLACLADSYIVTTGDNYNLQVWNRFPNTSNTLIEYSGTTNCINCRDIRFIFVQIDTATQQIQTVVVATPQYIVDKFGEFGIPTMKYQLIISDLKRREITQSKSKCLFFDDTEKMSYHTTKEYRISSDKISEKPKSGNLLSINVIKNIVVDSLLGKNIANTDTKNRGQALERIVADFLGYKVDETLTGGYPDIPNQLLEIKVQDSATVDLGKYSPSNPVVVNDELGLTTEDIRYLIALTDEKGAIEGVILCPGKKLGSLFTFVNDTNFKCQRSIPMSFFNNYKGSSAFNP